MFCDATEILQLAINDCTLHYLLHFYVSGRNNGRMFLPHGPEGFSHQARFKKLVGILQLVHEAHSYEMQFW